MKKISEGLQRGGRSPNKDEVEELPWHNGAELQLAVEVYKLEHPGTEDTELT